MGAAPTAEHFILAQAARSDYLSTLSKNSCWTCPVVVSALTVPMAFTIPATRCSTSIRPNSGVATAPLPA